MVQYIWITPLLLVPTHMNVTGFSGFPYESFNSTESNKFSFHKQTAQSKTMMNNALLPYTVYFKMGPYPLRSLTSPDQLWDLSVT